MNKADTSILKRIPGIGSTLARMIVVYRQRLGGFYDVSQLQEVPHVRVELNKWFVVTPAGLHKIQVNSASLDKLSRKRGKIKGLSQLSMFEEFTEKDLKRLSPYLTFE